NAQQEIPRGYCLPRVLQEAASLELSVGAADENVRNVIVLVLIRIPHVGAVKNQGVIQQCAVAIRSGLQLFGKVRHRRNVVSIPLGIVEDSRRNALVMGSAVKTHARAAIRKQIALRERIASARQIASAEQRCNARDIRLESQRGEIKMQLDVII